MSIVGTREGGASIETAACTVCYGPGDVDSQVERKRSIVEDNVCEAAGEILRGDVVGARQEVEAGQSSKVHQVWGVEEVVVVGVSQRHRNAIEGHHAGDEGKK